MEKGGPRLATRGIGSHWCTRGSAQVLAGGTAGIFETPCSPVGMGRGKWDREEHRCSHPLSVQSEEPHFSIAHVRRLGYAIRTWPKEI